LKIYFEAFPSSLYSRKPYFSAGCGGIFFLVPELSSALMEHALSLVLDSGIVVEALVYGLQPALKS
jgi:hypothetical protein